MTMHRFATKRVVKNLQRGLSVLAIFALAVGLFPVTKVYAGSVTSAKDTISTLASAAQGTHAFSFTTATSLTATQTIILMFNEGTSDWTLDGTIANTDFSAASGVTFVANVGACSGGASNEVYPTVTNGANDFYTLTVCTSDTVTAGAIAFTIDNNEITNPTVGSPTSFSIDITTTSDSGSISVGIVPDDSVNITATVDPSITFSISDTAIGFGTLVSGGPRFATSDALGSGSDPAAGAHNMIVSTNAANGYAVTYNGATLTAPGPFTIPGASIPDDADGTAGVSQFAVSFERSGDATVAAGYQYDDGAAPGDWNFVAGSTQSVITETGPTASETFETHYLANIAGNQQAGTYTTDLTYIATATF